MRADAKKNYAKLLDVARTVVGEQGSNASLRDVARRAGVGLGTLYRHFPTREALLQALLRESFDQLTAKAQESETSSSPAEALLLWLQDVIAVAQNPRGVVASMQAAIADEHSALHASCTTMKAAGTRLLNRAQAAGLARSDVEGADLFALVGAMAWIYDQPSLALRADHLFGLIAGAVLTQPVTLPSRSGTCEPQSLHRTSQLSKLSLRRHVQKAASSSSSEAKRPQLSRR